MAGEAKEKCAVVGALSANIEVDAAAITFLGLDALQHRGEEASGIASISYGGQFEIQRGKGQVPFVHDEEAMSRLAGNVAVGHNRYSTSGSKEQNFGPMSDKAIHFALSLNGTLPSTLKLERYLDGHNIRHENTNDFGMMSYALAQEIRNGKEAPEAIEKTYPLFTGAFSCVAMHDDMIMAFRDPFGIRPLSIGKIADGHMVASETCALDMANAEYIGDVEPGELVIITKDGLERKQLVDSLGHKLDMFEYVYFSKLDSMLYGQRVGSVRRHFGEQLASEYPLDGKNYLVVPVPDSSVPVAEGYADALGLQHTTAIIKNRYRGGGRSFMQKNQELRQKYQKLKHTVIPEFVKDRDLIVIDDSIVRLNTMPVICELLEAAGARSITVLVSSPPIRFPDFYGIDTPDQGELAAANFTVAEIEKKLSKCRKLGYLSLAGMIKATGLPEEVFNLSCFTGDYPIDIGYHKKEIYTPVSMEFAD